ncbi:5-oxoprolinase subunit PxpB [Bacillus manliponensis]|uniref:5-oxoprolinase subunit PxpB n=1 Tax=Bacillus manliponensis TaxID=574376 RepID=UPI003515070A
MKLEFYPLGDTGIQIVFGTKISEETNQKIRMFAEHLTRHPISGVIEWVPAYTTLSLYYRPDVIIYRELRDKLESIYEKVQGGVGGSTSLIFEIPTYYGGETGSDLSFVAEHNGISEEEVISIHSGQDYLIYMMGFVPGFPYLGGMSKRIATPRRENPRPKINVGSVGIAGEQTGIYPLETPGGWQIIGQTPLKLYDPNSNNPILLSSGHYLRFVPISERQYAEIENAIKLGEYTVNCFEK